MTFDSVIIPILTFLLGAVITAFSFLLSFTSRFAKLETKLDTINVSISGVCSEQGRLLERTNNHAERLTRLEVDAANNHPHNRRAGDPK